MQLIDNSGNTFGIPGVEIIGPDGKPKTIGGGGGGSPTGPAGGDLTGTYPNPGVNWSAGSPVYDLLYYPLSLNPAGYLTAITALDVTTALGYTPYNATNPSGYITAAALTGYLTSATAALTYYPLTNPAGYIDSSALAGYLTAATAAATYYPLTNPAGYIDATALSPYLTSASAAATYYPLSNPSGYITGITSAMINAALGYTPYDSANPAGYITSAALAPYLTSAAAALAYFPIPTGTTSQYLRGDGSLATFPTIPTVTPAALTKVDDTNVTLTLGGTPSTALLQAVSITVGWTGTLADSRIASAATWNAKQNALGYTPVPNTRNITINGTTYDLSADRTWTISTASNVAIQDEGSTLTSAVTSINFTGPNVAASAVGSAVTVNINGGTSSALFNYYNFI